MGRVAAVDVGTNSVRLLVAEPGEPLTEIERQMQITRLGQGVDATGHFDDEALRRTLNCIGGYAAKWRELGAERARITATSAVRDAGDRSRFFDGAEAVTGVRPVVLSGEEEARLAFSGATALIDAPPPYLVVDIGGGSTEFIVGDDQPHAAVSRQLGCVRLTERCLFTDPPTSEELAAATMVVDHHLAAIADTIPLAGVRTLIGVAGTVTTIGALRLGLASYDRDKIHGTRVPAAAVGILTDMLAGHTAAQRAALGPMAPGREDVIVGGALILRRVMERLGFGEVVASEADMLDGLALQLIGE